MTRLKDYVPSHRQQCNLFYNSVELLLLVNKSFCPVKQVQINEEQGTKELFFLSRGDVKPQVCVFISIIQTLIRLQGD